MQAEQRMTYRRGVRQAARQVCTAAAIGVLFLSAWAAGAAETVKKAAPGKVEAGASAPPACMASCGKTSGFG